VKDKNLNNFKVYSEEYYKAIQYNNSIQRYLMDDSTTTEDAKLMAETSALIRTKYLGGTSILNKQEIMNSQGYKLLTESGSQKNLTRMLNSDNTGNNRLQIPVP
jgi:hypothetical protein